MISLFLKNKKAASTLEYIVLVTIILMTILAFQKYIVRGFAGRWKSVGDSFGAGRQYDPQKTTECAWSEDEQLWYSTQCFDQKIDTLFPAYLSLCENNCLAFSGWGPCSSEPRECCKIDGWGIPRCSGACCSNKCEEYCKEVAEAQSVNDCLDAGGIPCN